MRAGTDWVLLSPWSLSEGCGAADKTDEASRGRDLRLSRKKMLKDRHEILAVGELALFLATWFATVWAAVDHFRQNDLSGNNLASSQRIERSLEKFD